MAQAGDVGCTDQAGGSSGQRGLGWGEGSRRLWEQGRPSEKWTGRREEEGEAGEWPQSRQEAMQVPPPVFP